MKKKLTIIIIIMLRTEINRITIYARKPFPFDDLGIFEIFN